MSNEIIIISPEFGDGRGGVADYTSRVVEEWRGQWPLRFLVPSGDYPIPDGAESFARNSNALRAKLPSSGGKLLVQYSAYGFDRHGFPRWLLRALTDWKHETRGRLVVMFHEIWTFWPRWNRNRFVQTLHRRAIGQLVSAADATFTSTAGQGEHLRAVGARSIEVLPVGTNIRVSHEAVARKEAGVAVLFGLQASRVKALELMKADLCALFASACLTKIITVGGGNT
ncbi:MAG: glycosyltransferase, partial [Verrucomicrobiota bacterium]|nr:glycosyltransferase [Verrucomicrobiota bacterium]